MNGKELHQAVQDSGIPIDKIIKEAPIARTTLFNLFKQEKVKQYYIDLLEKVGVKVLKSTQQVPNLAMYEKTIELLHKTIELLQEDSKTKERDTNIYRTIVETAVKEGTLKILKPSKKEAKV